MYRTAKYTHRIRSQAPTSIRDQTTTETWATFDQSGEVVALRLTVEIEHDSLGDLVLHLTSPAKTRVKLAGQSFRAGQSEEYAFDSETHNGLQKLRGEQAGGEWRVSVGDLVPRDEGTLRSWTLELDIRQK